MLPDVLDLPATSWLSPVLLLYLHWPSCCLEAVGLPTSSTNLAICRALCLFPLPQYLKFSTNFCFYGPPCYACVYYVSFWPLFYCWVSPSMLFVPPLLGPWQYPLTCSIINVLQCWHPSNSHLSCPHVWTVLYMLYHILCNHILLLLLMSFLNCKGSTILLWHIFNLILRIEKSLLPFYIFVSLHLYMSL